MMLTKKTKPVIHKRIHFLNDHTMDKGGRRLPQQLQVEMMAFLGKLGAKEDFPRDQVQRSIGILRTNGMKLEEGGLASSPGVVLYPTYCLINHACSNNTNYQKSPSLTLELRAQVAIRRGEEITTRYVSSTVGNYRRHRDINKYWYFSCRCARCSDPSEMGTHMSSVRCQVPGCPGLVAPLQPLVEDSPWTCSTCPIQYSSTQVDGLLVGLEEEVGVVNTMDIDGLEEALHRFSSHPVLHHNHFLVVELSHSLVFAYSSIRPHLTRWVELEEEVTHPLIFVHQIVHQIDDESCHFSANLV